MYSLDLLDISSSTHFNGTEDYHTAVTSTSHQLNTPEHLIIIELIEETQETTHMPQHAIPQEISHSKENIR